MKALISKLRRLIKRDAFDSKTYWEARYAHGGNSGSGSYGRLADFKAVILNQFVAKHQIKSVIEFGCGDGNQLALAKYPVYIGLDVSRTIIKKCAERFEFDNTKSFFLYDGEAFIDKYHIFRCELAISLDVIYHLVEPRIYDAYMKHLFQCADKFVIIYSSNKAAPAGKSGIHEKHREFTQDLTKFLKEWELFEMIENAYRPEQFEDEHGSIADFFIYKRRQTQNS